MEKREFKTERRISNIMGDSKFNNKFTNVEMRKMLRAFEALDILTKYNSIIMTQTNKRTFMLKIEEYNEKMQWINDFMKSKGMNEDIFTDLKDYEIASDDYDYYYELKTPTQYKKDEEARKAKKLGTKPTTEGRELADK